MQIKIKCAKNRAFTGIMKKEDKQKIKIVGTGFYVPEKILTNYDLEQMVDTSDEWIVTRTGIKERRIADENQATSDLGTMAGKRALENAGLKIDDIDLIMVATATPDTIFPSTACHVQRGLKADHIPAFDISAACCGLIYSLIIAEGLILAGTNKRILLIGGEMLTKITNWKDRNTCVLFGDAAGAYVVEKSNDESGLLSHYWRADGNLSNLLYMPAGGSRIPASKKSVEENLHYLHMRGNEVFKNAVKRMGEASLEALKKAGLEKKDVDLLIPHQANIRIIDAIGRRLKIPPEKVVSNIHKYGNVSVATIPIALHEARLEGKIKKGNIIIMTAFGGGFTWASLVYRW